VKRICACLLLSVLVSSCAMVRPDAAERVELLVKVVEQDEIRELLDNYLCVSHPQTLCEILSPEEYRGRWLDVGSWEHGNQWEDLAEGTMVACVIDARHIHEAEQDELRAREGVKLDERKLADAERRHPNDPEALEVVMATQRLERHRQILEHCVGTINLGAMEIAEFRLVGSVALTGRFVPDAATAKAFALDGYYEEFDFASDGHVDWTFEGRVDGQHVRFRTNLVYETWTNSEGITCLEIDEELQYEGVFAPDGRLYIDRMAGERLNSRMIFETADCEK
jgi:hypothetical protein